MRFLWDAFRLGFWRQVDEQNRNEGVVMEKDSVFNDGSVELCQRWQPGGAQGNNPTLYDGDQFIFAVRVICDRYEKRREFWEFHAVTARGDSETPLYFLLPNGDTWDDWEWGDVEWFLPVKDIDLPYMP